MDSNEPRTAVFGEVEDDPKTEVTRPSLFRVVGIGATAGGLASLEQFFGSMPGDSGMAFVVVQRLSPDFETLMAELLARYSDMTITLAVEDELVEPNHVYLSPPGKELELRGARLRLSRKEPRALPQPIDVFFRSLAVDMGPRAVAVVLAGSGNDGSLGILAVKAAGGTVLAESVETAGFDGMPASAAATGVVDFVGAPRELANFLSGIEASERFLEAEEPEARAPASTELLESYDRLLDRFMPPSFLVDEDARLLDSFSGAERFLRVKSRRPTGNLLDLLEGDLKAIVAGALGRVARERTPVTCRNVSVEEGGAPSDYTVHLELVQQPRAETRHVLVALEKAPEELRATHEEPQQLDVDLGHLLESTETETGFQRDLRIRRTTERVGSIIPLAHRTGPGPQAGDGSETPTRAPSGVLLTMTDIGALDRARERLAQLSAIVESSEDAILRKDLTGRIETWNRGAERLYGYTAEEAVGRDVRFLCTEEGAGEVDRFLASIRRGERIDHVETLRMRKDGCLVDVSVSVSPVLDEEGRVVAASAIARDITELRNAQRDAEQRQQQIQQLLDSTAEAIYGLDVQGICTFCNPACARLLGYASPSDLIGRDMHELVHRGRLRSAPHECGLTTAFRGGGSTHSSDEVFWRSNGTCFAAEYWSHPVERDGEVVGAVVTFLDITERRQAEEEVRAASRRRERFLALLSHELRNPLAAILNAIRVVSSGAGAADIQERALHVVDRQGRHMARLLDDLLDVSRITSGKFELRKERVRVDDAVTSAIEALEPLLRDQGVTLAATLPSAPLFVDGDGARLQQVVANLLSNAARYSPSGSRVELSLRAEGRSVVLSVRDWGAGIEPAFLPHVFDLFAQSEQATRVARGGLGIGLTLVRRIVDLHDGTVEAKSAGPGLGSEFVVRIPSSTGATDLAGQPPVGGAERCRIVLVEDQEDAREMLRALLELRGHTVVDVGDAREAIETIGREQPDVAVVDIGLPELSGYDVARAVRSGPGGKHVFMVALTGYGSQADVRAAEEAGFDAHLTKPAEPERLFQLLARRTPSEARRLSGAWSEVDGAERPDVTASRRNLAN